MEKLFFGVNILESMTGKRFVPLCLLDRAKTKDRPKQENGYNGAVLRPGWSRIIQKIAKRWRFAW
jgi:hypothetical protein